jgi:hypothetical protein
VIHCASALLLLLLKQQALINVMARNAVATHMAALTVNIAGA